MKLLTWTIRWSIRLFLGAILMMTSLALAGLITLTVVQEMLLLVALLLVAGVLDDGTRTGELHIGDWLESTEPSELNRLSNLKAAGLF